MRDKVLYCFVLSFLISCPLRGIAQFSLVADINLGTEFSNPGFLTVLQDKLYFAAKHADFGRELFVYDGTEVSLVADIDPGEANSGPRNLTVFNGNLFFWANQNPGSIKGLFKYDGTTVQLVTEFKNVDGDHSGRMVEYQGDLYFQGTIGSDYDYELYRYDGNVIELVADIRPGSDGSSPNFLKVYNNKLFFSAYRLDVGRELWSYDGTNVNLEHDINPGTMSSNPAYLTVYDDELYFTAFSVEDGEGPRVFDDQTSEPLLDTLNNIINVLSSGFIPYNDKLCFFGIEDGYAWLWEFNEMHGSRICRLPQQYGTMVFEDFMIEVYAGMLLTWTEAPEVEGEMWAYNGNTCQMISDINPVGSSAPQSFCIYDNTLYFSAFTEDFGRELWSYTAHVDIRENTVSSQHLVYPNPANNLVYIRPSSTYNVAQVFDLYGRLVSEHIIGKADEIAVLLPNRKGIYLIRLVNETGNSTSATIINN
ncbi:MAG: T9SS type A sorting domain-containing protein [Bacteroidetes bacterium]|nr:MAG: T9SS type A sorting domain-containing protein [Bacteroidota bacterium]